MHEWELSQPITRRPMNGARLLDMVSSCVGERMAAWHDGPDHFEWSHGDVPSDVTLAIKHLLTKLAYHNYQIWHYEDRARSTDDGVVAAAKRSIDAHNQARNDCIEELDSVFCSMQANDSAQRSVETLGSIIDRVSVVRLKMLHACAAGSDLATVNVLFEQHSFLQVSAASLFDRMLEGKASAKIFRQCKQYNDPRYNRFIQNRVDAQHSQEAIAVRQA